MKASLTRYVNESYIETHKPLDLTDIGWGKQPRVDTPCLNVVSNGRNTETCIHLSADCVLIVDNEYLASLTSILIHTCKAKGIVV